MPPADRLLPFGLLAAALILVPGPSVMFVISRALAHGRRAALLTVLGNAVGVFGQVVLVAAGLGALVARSAAVFTTIKLAGAAYLVWLGVQALRHRHQLGDDLQEQDQHAGRHHSLFIDGVVVGIANPKAIVFFAAILPQFVAPGGAPIALQMMVLGLVFVTIALVCDGAWGLTAGTARAWFARSPRRLARIGGAGGVAMIGLGLQLATTGRRD
ncbi:LysE family translocator [Nitriliruptor alkaliphilus]|uniref:LysE family translocator n=1 Tax=Nitriliruptor alkaliphilus TaxID=427918 RepID=UPI000698D851|nr:LysE family translocator [Nitriliruptor alkaliphilus]